MVRRRVEIVKALRGWHFKAHLREIYINMQSWEIYLMQLSILHVCTRSASITRKTRLRSNNLDVMDRQK